MRVIINASPLIVLFKSGLEELLPEFCDEVIVPAAVWDEVLLGGADDPAALALPNADWARCVEVTTFNADCQGLESGSGRIRCSDSGLRDDWLSSND